MHNSYNTRKQVDSYLADTLLHNYAHLEYFNSDVTTLFAPFGCTHALPLSHTFCSRRGFWWLLVSDGVKSMLRSKNGYTWSS